MVRRLGEMCSLNPWSDWPHTICRDGESTTSTQHSHKRFFASLVGRAFKHENTEFYGGWGEAPHCKDSLQLPSSDIQDREILH